MAHASRLAAGEPGGQIAVILEVARPVEVAPPLLAAYALTPRETEVAALVLAGHSTEAIAATLVISPFTVQQHLKAMFEKVGVRSRRGTRRAGVRRAVRPTDTHWHAGDVDGWYLPTTAS